MKRLLVANRGEIACRIFRSACSLGIETVAVYSEADANAPHALLADHAVCIGPPPVGESYLDGEKIIAAAKRVGADAIHPGYGFLSENASFAQAVIDAHLIWVGPPPSAIASMGDKAAAKKHMRAAKVPTAPGCDVQVDTNLEKAAELVGFPLLVKATAGGGGRGIRQVNSPEELPEAIARARSEAGGAFGNDAVMLERLIESAHHVEIQVLADTHGQALHFFDRDCSLQRRRQKLIEEAPSPIVDAGLRLKMGEAAVNAAKATGYLGAGTVEFLVDQDGGFYFLEMNTRLQVEHPVTELICGVDLVEWQLRIAMGEALPWQQSDIGFTGHAIEARLCAEDPARDHLPCVGDILHWSPAQMDGVRIDAGISQCQQIGAHYDSMLGKVIAWGPDRETARRRLIRALTETSIMGIVVNRSFLISLLASDAFRDSLFDTGFVDRFDWTVPKPSLHAWILAATLHSGEGDGWNSRGKRRWSLSLLCGEEERLIEVRSAGKNRYEMLVDGVSHDCCVTPLPDSQYRVGAMGWDRTLSFCLDGHEALVDEQGHVFRFSEPLSSSEEDDTSASDTLRAPMQGRVIAINGQNGEAFDKGFCVFVIEAMKMEHPVVMPRDGTLVEISLQVGDLVASGQILGRLELEENS